MAGAARAGRLALPQSSNALGRGRACATLLYRAAAQSVPRRRIRYGPPSRRPEVKEAILIATNEPRRIHRSEGGQHTRAAASSGSAQRKTAQAKPAAPARKSPQKQKKSRSSGKKHPVLSFIVRFIAVCACLGIMACSAAAVAVVYYVVEATANDDLNLDRLSQSQSSTIVAYDSATGQWIETATLKSTDSHRLQASLSEIPENLQWAFICTEDKDFYNEPGVNIKRTIAATINEYIFPILPSKQGASTIEQQLVKNLTQEKADSGVAGALRKVREIFRAWGIYKNFSKQTILECYLNTISFTGTIQGVKTAAVEYFGKDVSELTLSECAVIASITKAPRSYDPYNNPENLLERRNLVLYNMYTQGKITEAEYQQAKAEPLVLAEESATTGTTTQNVRSYFDDALYEQLITDFMAAYNWTREQASNYIFTGGLTIQSTMDPSMQAKMEQVMLNTDDKYFPAGWVEEETTQLLDTDTPVYNEDGTLKTKTNEDGTVIYYRKVRTQAAMVTVDYDGNVLALVGGLGQKATSASLNRAYSVARQTGSSIKPLTVYSQGIECGLYTWSTMILDGPLYTAEDEKVKDSKTGAWRDWPKNYGGTYSYEEVPLYMGLARSLNTIAAQIGDTVGVDAMYNVARNTLQLNHFTEDDANLAALCMGSQAHGATPLEMAAAFQIFNDGKYTTPHLYTKVYDSDGNLVLEADTTSYQALTPQTATIMNRLLHNVTAISGGTAARLGGQVAGHDTIGKTGTASDERDLWFVGATSYYVTSVWWGYDNPKDMRATVGRNAAKTSTCVDAWKAYNTLIHESLEPKAWPMAETGVVMRPYCTASGLLASDACVSTAQGYYREDALPDVCDYGY